MELSLDLIWSGKQSSKSRWFHNISGQIGSLLAKFSQINTESERVQFVLDLFKTKNPFHNVEAFRKSTSLSTQFRTQGNALYKEKKFKEALRSYNLSICFSPPESQELYLAIANRSAIHFEQRQFKLCQLDVNLVMKCSIDCPEILQLKTKLGSRLERCIKESLECESACEKSTATTTTSPSPLEFDLSLKNQNRSITSAEDFIDIQNNESRGRHVVTKKFVPVGTLLIVEDPFAKVLLNQYRWDVNHCHTCLGTISTGIPCDSCVFDIFCSPSCREAQDVYMCQISSHLYSLNPSRTLLLATKIITKMGPTKLYDLFLNPINNNNIYNDNNHNKDSEIDKKGDIILPQQDPDFPLGFVNGVYDSEDYHTILNLIHHKVSPSELLEYTLDAAAVTEALWCYSTFFDLHRDLNFKTLVCQLIISHLQNLPPNAHSINEVVDFDLVEYGAGAYSLLSLINHSCDPNVTRFNLANGSVAVIAIKSIDSNTELLDNYGVHYAVNKFEERQKHLSEHYYFTCDCLACLCKYPLFRDLKQQQQQSQLMNHTKNTNNRVKSNRNKNNNIEDRSSEIAIERTNEKFEHLFAKVMGGEKIELTDLVQCMEFYETIFNLPYFKFNEAQETFKHYMNVTIRKSIRY